MIDQKEIVNDVSAFLNEFGLKNKHLAKVCGIKEHIFSKFLHEKIYLSPYQIQRVKDYLTDYTQRMS